MAKVKAFALAALAVMTIGMAATTEAAKPVGTHYDFFVCVEDVKDWRVSNYDAGVNVPKVTAKEARFGGYDANNVPATNITEEEWEEMMRGNGDDPADSDCGK